MTDFLEEDKILYLHLTKRSFAKKKIKSLETW